MNKNILSVNNIHTSYQKSYVLRGVSLQVPEHSAVALLGRNGMGKTTTIRSITGLTPARKGTIIFKDIDITKTSPNHISLMGIGLVPQGRRIFPSLSVKENIVIAERTRGKSNPWTLEKIYDMFPVLKKRSAIKGTLLSGGEQQMLAIARALMANPDLLLMDEPSEGLSPLVVKELGNTLVDLKKSGLSIVIVEQNLPLALKVADEAYIITAGQIVHSSTTIELAKNEEIKEKYIGVSGRSNYDHMKTKDGKGMVEDG